MALKSSSLAKNTGSLRHKIIYFWRYAFTWFTDTPERALTDAYKAATVIREIEIEQFNGKKISDDANYSTSVMNYWQVALNNNLNIVKFRLAEFRLSRSLIKLSNHEILEKLKYIDEIVTKYLQDDELFTSSSIVTVENTETTSHTKTTIATPDIISSININNQSQIQRQEVIQPPIKTQKTQDEYVESMRVKPVSQKSGILPRSIGRTFNRLKDDFAPHAEEKYVQNFRVSRRRTQAAVKFIVMLAVIPLITHLLTKQFLVSPIVERTRGENNPHIFMNSSMEDEALEELKIFERGLKFESFILKAPTLTPEEIGEKVKEKAIEIASEFRDKSNNAISNIFADMFSLVAFAVVVATSKREIVILKAFLDDVVYGLSDSAKAFLIIVFTDIFVGFHSPHGWEVLLEGLAEHLGLPPNRSAIFLFIATFPVVLDTIFKYWIFRYLSRLSPSALATLKEMNE
ncbi:CemA family protein [Calothrix sp. NIES-4071]|nr:CemA family protein [Calothrix sp. NIES-4071]BAZ58016.1 CemA family protein [Calothrix sp. NIES-4105]